MITTSMFVVVYLNLYHLDHLFFSEMRTYTKPNGKKNRSPSPLREAIYMKEKRREHYAGFVKSAHSLALHEWKSKFLPVCLAAGVHGDVLVTERPHSLHSKWQSFTGAASAIDNDWSRPIRQNFCSKNFQTVEGKIERRRDVARLVILARQSFNNQSFAQIDLLFQSVSVDGFHFF
jgi:hypothetical protein